MWIKEQEAIEKRNEKHKKKVEKEKEVAKSTMQK